MTDELRRPRRASGARPIARHGRLARGGVARAVVGLVATALAVVLVAGASVAAVAAGQLLSSVKSDVHLVHLNGATAPPSIGAIRGGVNLLLVGTDTRTGQVGAGLSTRDSSGLGNNDVTILLHVAQDHKSVTVVSFPRDMLVTIPSCPNPKGGSYGVSYNAMLNTSLSHGGLACPVLTIEKLIPGLEIPYAAEISFDGVAAMSNVVGGVTVCVATPINDPASGLQLSAGEHTIQGYQALAFVRVRHGVADGSDLSRISNQQVFLSALARKITSEGVLKDPLKLYEIAKAATSNMTLSDELSQPTTMISMAIALKSVPLQDMVMFQYPVVTAPTDPNRVIAASGTAAIVNQALVKDQPIQLSGTTGRGAELDPNATPAPAATATPGATGTPAPTDSSTASATVTLPSTVTGQTAAQQTCTKGNGH